MRSFGPARRAYADGGVRVGEITRFAPALGDFLRGFGSVTLTASNSARMA